MKCESGNCQNEAKHTFAGKIHINGKIEPIERHFCESCAKPMLDRMAKKERYSMGTKQKP